MYRPNECNPLADLLVEFFSGSVLETPAVLIDVLDDAKYQFDLNGDEWPDRLEDLLADLKCSPPNRDALGKLIAKYRLDLEKLYSTLRRGSACKFDATAELARLNLKDREKKIILALEHGALMGEGLALRLNEEFNGYFRGFLSCLTQTRMILDNKRDGYFVREEYRWLFSALNTEAGGLLGMS